MSDEFLLRMRKLKQFVEIEFAKETDRGVALLSMCLIEDGLHENLRARMDLDVDALRNIAPRGNIPTLLSNCRAIGILHPKEVKAIDAINGIRKKFAHGAEAGLTFETKEVANLIRQLPNDRDIPLNKETLRNRFILTVADAYALIAIRRSSIQKIAEAKAIWT